MSRYFPSMKKHSWIILVCTVITLMAGVVLAKAQPTAYQANTTLLVIAGAPGTNLPNATANSSDSLGQSSDDAAEIPTRSVLTFVYQSNPTISQHGYAADDLLADITTSNPSATSATIQVTATTTSPGDAVLLANDVAYGYAAYKTKQAQDELNAERTSLQNQYNQYKTQSNQLEQKILSYSNTSDPHIALLTADRNSLILAENTAQSQLLQLPGTVRGDVFVIQSAKIGDVTSSSKALLILAVTGGLGLLVGLFIWFLVVFVSNRLRADDQVPEKLGLSYLGGLTSSREIQAGMVPTSGQAAQELTNISANLRMTGILSGSWRAPQGAIVAVTSAQAVEGKTTVATGLAAVIARSGRSVLVIDGNVSHPQTHLALGTTPTSYGLSGLLKATGGENLDGAVQRTNLPGVWLLPGGAPLENATLLLEQRLPGILAQLRKKTDWIIIDSPALLSGADASLLASMADGVALVVDARHDKIALLLRASEVLRSLTHTPVGVVMNHLSPRKRNPYYAVAYAEEMATEATPAGQKHANNGNGHDQTLGQPAFAPQRDFPLVQPSPNPPSPFPSPRRADMTPPNP